MTLMCHIATSLPTPLGPVKFVLANETKRRYCGDISVIFVGYSLFQKRSWLLETKAG
jgi:hypothetical protein